MIQMMKERLEKENALYPVDKNGNVFSFTSVTFR